MINNLPYFSKHVNLLNSKALASYLLNSQQHLHSSVKCLAIDKALLSKLRKKTGFALSQCKKALELHDSNIEKAEEWLLKEAQAHGWAKATKLSGRSTTQGLIGVHIEKNVAGLVEINCETDFVARNSDFHSLLQNITKIFTTSTAPFIPAGSETLKEVISKENLSAIKTKDDQSLSDLVALAIGKIGENIQLGRSVKFACSPDVHLVGYTHPPPSSDLGLYGRYGAVVAFKTAPNPKLARELCAHIIGMNPKTIGTYVEPTENEEPEKSSSKVRSSEDNDEEEAEEVPENESVDKPLVYQDFLSDQETKVGQVLKENNIEIIDFVRLECGGVQA